jgi:hypothetical protein
MKDQLETAGVDTAAARLAASAYDALKVAKNRPALAADGWVESILADADLVHALMRASRHQLHAAAYAYLVDRSTDMQGIGASQETPVSQKVGDRPDQSDAGASHAARASQASPDRPGVGATFEKPVHVREHNRREWGGRKKQPAAPTRISAKAAIAYASTSIFAREIGSGKMRIGDLTKFDVINIKRRGLIDSVIADGLLELNWPDDQKTKVHEIASEQQIEATFARAYTVLDSLGMAHAS